MAPTEVIQLGNVTSCVGVLNKLLLVVVKLANVLSPLKALSPIVTLPLVGNFTILKFVISLKAPLPIEVTEAGSVIEVNFVFLKALFSILLTLAGNVMLVKCVLPSKAEAPIVVRFVLLCKFKLVMPVPLINCAPNELTLLGKVKFVKLEHPLKAWAWMVVNCVLLVKLTVVRFVHLLISK